MRCVRCFHELPARADRCLRCFALNPQNRPEALAWAQPSPPPAPLRRSPLAAMDLDLDSDPAPGLQTAIDSTPPPPRREPRDDPFTMRFDEIPAADLGRISLGAGQVADFHAALTDPPSSTPPPRARPGPLVEPAHSEPLVEPAHSEPLVGPAHSEPLVQPVPAQQPGPLEPGHGAAPSLEVAPLRAQLLAWALDGALLLACAALQIALAALVVGPAQLAPRGPRTLDSWVDLLLFGQRLPLLWALLCGCVALAYSWLFAALGGRTPGLALAGLRLTGLRGGALSPGRALLRAALALPSFALGLFGFALAIFDARGQTLHDKLAGSIVVTRTPGQ